MSNDDTPSTVYAVVVKNANVPLRFPSEKAQNKIVYVELDLEPKRRIYQRSSEAVLSSSGENPNQTVYAELDLHVVPRRRMQEKSVGLLESEYANSLMDYVYANSPQTRV